MTAATIPVTVAGEAAARVAELGMLREFEQMLEQARKAVPRLKYLKVTRESDPTCPANEPRLVIWARREDVPGPDALDPVDADFRLWQAQHFPPQVYGHFLLLSVYGDVDEW
jgi:hypothetical protein